MWSITASHRPPSPLSLWEAASPAVTDCHSYGNSFKNIHHSISHSHYGRVTCWEIPLDFECTHKYAYILQTSLRSAQNIKKNSSQWHFLTMLFMHSITWCEHLFMCWCQCCSQDHLNPDKYIDTETRPRLKGWDQVKTKTRAVWVKTISK